MENPPHTLSDGMGLTANRIRRALCLMMVTAGLMLAALASPPAKAQSARYVVDPEHMSIGFLVEHMGYEKMLGMFTFGGGSFNFDEQTGALSDVRIEIDTASVFTNHRKRDDHLKGADFLNSAKYPKMVFTAAQARRTGERDFVVDGQLELIGRSQPVTLNVRWNKSGYSALPMLPKPYLMGVSIRGTIKRSAFGMNYGVANSMVGDDIDLIIELEAARR